MAGTGPDYHKAQKGETPCERCVYRHETRMVRLRCTHPEIARFCLGSHLAPVGRRHTCIYADDGGSC
jgi:hypothetical protein